MGSTPARVTKFETRKIPLRVGRYFGFWELAGELFVEVGVIVEFFRFEPKGDFFFGFFGVAAGVDEIWYAHAFSVRITEAHVGIITTNSTHFGGFWLGRTDNLAHKRYGFDTFENDSDDWTGHHVVEVVAKGLFAAAGDHFADVFIVSTILIFIRHDHLHTNNLKANALEALHDFTDDTALDGVWLADDKTTLD